MGTESISKICSKCKQIKPLSEFYETTKNKDGYRNKCKICYLQSTKEYRQTDNGRLAEKRYKKSPKGKKVARNAHHKWYYKNNGQTRRKIYSQSIEGKRIRQRIIAKYNQQHPEKVEARKAIKYAIRHGNLNPPTDFICNQCPAQAKEWHHYLDYAPEHFLDVIPVCIPCHKKLG